MRTPVAVVCCLAACSGSHSQKDDGARVEQLEGGEVKGTAGVSAIVDAQRTAAVYSDTQRGPARLAVLDLSGKGWSRLLGCVDVTSVVATIEIVAIMCHAKSNELWTAAYKTVDGSRVWLARAIREVGELAIARSFIGLEGELIFENWEYGFAALDLKTGEEKWRRGHNDGYFVVGDKVVEDHLLSSTALSLKTGQSVGDIGRVQGVSEGGLCVVHEDTLAHWDGITYELLIKGVAALEDRYGHFVACGQRGERTVLSFDHN
ncbi:hypothetical protein BH09MYX1_BH09MYX1_65300 [soil metagenome]